MKGNKLALTSLVFLTIFSINLNIFHLNANCSGINTLKICSLGSENNLQESPEYFIENDVNNIISIEKIRKFDNNTNGTPFLMPLQALESGMSLYFIIIGGVLVIIIVVISVVIVRKRRIVVNLKETTKFQVDSIDELEEIITLPFKVIPRDIYYRVQSLKTLSEEERNLLLKDLATIDEKYWEEWLQMVENNQI